MNLIEPQQSKEFVKALEDNNFDLSDWEYLETLLQYEGLNEEQMHDLGKLRATLKEISDKYSV